MLLSKIEKSKIYFIKMGFTIINTVIINKLCIVDEFIEKVFM